MLDSPGLPERFWDKVEPCPMSGCWHWTAAGTGNGYGQIFFDGKVRMAHRVSYEVLVSPIPDGLQIDHLCRNRGCCNPTHLEPVTPRENTMRSDSPRLARERQLSKTHCPRGHEYDEENTRIYRGKRNCRACDRERWRRLFGRGGDSYGSGPQ